MRQYWKSKLLNVGKVALYAYLTLLILITMFGDRKPEPTYAATVPAGFVETLVASGFSVPTGIELAPDGRVFLTQQNGVVRIIKNGTLLPTPFVTVPTDTTVDLGLMGLTFHPSFATNQFIYLYYTRAGSPPRNRISRFTAS